MKNHLRLIATLLVLPLFLSACGSSAPTTVEEEQVEVKNPRELLEELSTFVTKVTDYKEVQLHKSVMAYEICFETNSTKPLRMCLLDVDLTDRSLAFKTTYPSDFTETKWPVRTMLKQAQLAEEQGENVLVAFNADFFDMGGTGFPEGAVYHNGKGIRTDNLKGKDVLVFFGTDKDGKAIIGSYSDYIIMDKSGISELVCGKTQLIKNGRLTDNGDPALAPRTAVGTNQEKNRVYVVVVDELTPNTPRNGITYKDLALCMKTLGAVHAVNLDGGGSSTFLVKEGNSFRAWNKQPGASLRSVADGMVLTVK